MSSIVTGVKEMAEASGMACKDCEREIECCEFCEQDGCSCPICYRCLRVALRESLPEPHAHGG